MNYSRIIGEAPLRVMNPSVMVPRLDLVVLELAAAGSIFRRLLGFWEYWGIYRAKRRFGGTRGGHNPPGRAWASWHTLVGRALLGAPPGAALAH